MWRKWCTCTFCKKWETFSRISRGQIYTISRYGVFVWSTHPHTHSLAHLWALNYLNAYKDISHSYVCVCVCMFVSVFFACYIFSPQYFSELAFYESCGVLVIAHRTTTFRWFTETLIILHHCKALCRENESCTAFNINFFHHREIMLCLFSSFRLLI